MAEKRSMYRVEVAMRTITSWKKSPIQVDHIIISHADIDHAYVASTLENFEIRFTAHSGKTIRLEKLREAVRARVPVRGWPSTPPTWANFMLFCLLSKRDRQSVVGDLQEQYHAEVLPEFGPRRAWFWYWTRAVSTAAYRNPICRWLLIGGGILKVGEWIARRMSG